LRGKSTTAADRTALRSAWERARLFSPFLNSIGQANPDLLDVLLENGVASALRLAAAAGQAGDLTSRLRRKRNRTLFALALGDLSGALTLQDVMKELSALADETVGAALAGAFSERFGSEATPGLTILALGKHGSRELNYSSDIDLILLYDPDLIPRRGRDGAGDSALRLTRRFVELLSRRTEDGHVFRVDLRLRPASEVTPLALPVEAAIAHYESSALPWERAAFIRARTVGGDRDLGARFLHAIAPFRWRRALDFQALDEVRHIAKRMREHFADRQNFGPGYDLKRGQGGIRELEFLIQAEQLVFGGRNQTLRAPAILPALSALTEAGLMGAEDATALAGHYRLLRTIEHRLQMVEDQQTHRLPDGDALDGVARLHGVENGTALLDLLRPAAEDVARRFNDLMPGLGVRPVRVPVGEGELGRHLDDLMLGTPQVRRTIARWREGLPRALRTAPSRDALEAMLPVWLEALAASPDPNAALARFDRLLDALPGGVDLLSMLAARPDVTAMLAEIMAQSPALAEQLTSRPGLLDVLLDRNALDLPGGVGSLEGELADARAAYEAQLDRVRRQVGERRFAIGTTLVTGRADPLEAGQAYARVAEAALRVLAGATVSAFEAAHGRVAGGELGAIALGRLGGGVLTHASDLDLVFVWTGPTDAVSDGPKPLRATDYHNRLARRLVAAFALQTAAGPLYDVDTRLRPQGSDGMLAVSAEGFERYQTAEAWMWERMALTRARPVLGSEETRGLLDASIARALDSSPDLQAVFTGALDMRRQLRRGKPSCGPLDVKLERGGLVDLEFGVQALQLGRGTARTPRLGEAVAALVRAGLAHPELAGAHDLLTRMLICLRLLSPGCEVPPPAARARVARACGLADWNALERAHEEARGAVDRFTASLWGEAWCLS